MPPESFGLTSETYSPSDLIAGHSQIITKEVTILSGQNLVAGALLGKITASGKYILSLSAATDGSEVPDAILSEAANASSGDLKRIVYIAGEFNENKMIFGTGHTASSVRHVLRDMGIFLKAPVKA